MSFSKAIGAVSKAALRIEGGATSGPGLQSTAYPTTEATADTEEVLLQGSDQIHLLSESLTEEWGWQPNETLVGTPAAESSDNISIMVIGSIEVAGYYDGLDQIIALAMGMEIGDATNSPTAQSSTAVASTGATAGGTWDDDGTPFASGDVGKFIRCTVGVNTEGQVRRITTFTDSNTVSITPNWTSTPDADDSGVMSTEWLHLFEMTNDLQDEDWDIVDTGYPTGGIGASGDQLVRRATIGFLKANTIPQIFRSCMINSLTFVFNPNDGLKLTAEIMGFNRDLASSTNTTGTASSWDFDHNSATFVENEKIVFADADHFRIDAFANGALGSADNYGISDFELTINNQLKGDDQSVVSGLYPVQPARNGMREVTGSFTLPRYETDQFHTWLTAKTVLAAELSISGSTMVSNARNITIYIPSLQLTSVSGAIGGPGLVPLKVSFRAQVPASALSGVPTANLTAPRSELMIETLNQNPYSSFRDQQREY